MRRLSTITAVSAVAAIAVPLLLAGPASAAGSVAAETSAGECTVAGGDLTWGFKESFRAYISGTIANGTWTEIAPATYSTPDFSWPATDGSYDPATGAGEISFSGGIEFTGHDGLLDTTIANPTLVLAADGTAQLLLDISGLSMDDALAGNTDNVQTYVQTPFVSLDVTSTPLTVGDDTISGTAVPTAITAEGFEAFGNYEAGTAFDPVTFTIALSCAAAETATPTASATETLLADDDMTVDLAATAWVWLAPVLIAAIVVAAVVVVVFLVARRRGRAGGPRDGGDAK
ncbi:MAG: HtaA domain-containing protein [Microbacterium sp.]|uniref:HtaA domain-containing protein n=1 Tax=Microbacterium sp. TaxID=51671 RepID=UPI0039E62FE8